MGTITAVSYTHLDVYKRQRVARFAVGRGPTVAKLDSPEAMRDAIARVRETEP